MFDTFKNLYSNRKYEFYAFLITLCIQFYEFLTNYVENLKLKCFLKICVNGYLIF